MPRRIEVPVELPEGVSREGVFGEKDGKQNIAMPMLSSGVMARSVVVGSGRGGGGGGARTESRAMARKSDSAKNKRRVDKSASGSASGNASASNAMSVDVVDEPARKLTPKEQKEAELLAKLHPTIAALIERIKTKKTQPGADEARFVRDNKAEIQIWLTDKSPQVIAELKKLGFEVVLDPQSAKMVIGRIALDKLAALADVKAVRYMAPQISA